MADEVYQTNVYKDDVKFISMRNVLHELGEPYRSEVELISMHSISKGLLGECGFRGGYTEIVNLPKRAKEMMYKLKSINLVANSIGQIACGLMCDPPRQGIESTACVQEFTSQQNAVMAGLVERADLLEKTFNEMDNITCARIEGAMYAFPSVHFTDKFLRHAKMDGRPADFLYCLEMLEQTGIMTVPGSGFGQRDGTNHFRITNLVSPTSRMEATLSTLQ